MKTRIYTWQPVELREAVDDEPAKITGLAAVFYDGTPKTEFRLGDFIERIEPGAFDRAIREDDVFGLFNHDDSLVLGRKKAGTLELTTDRRGLNYEITPGDTTIARDVTELIRRKEITGSSFAFVSRDGGERWEEDEDGIYIRTLTDLKLYDVSPVTYPAYKATEASVRTACEEAVQAFRDRRDRELSEELDGYASRAAAATVACLDIDTVDP